MMKRYSLLLLVALLAFTACKDDDDNDNGPSPAEIEAMIQEQAGQIETRLTSENLTFEEDQYGIYDVTLTARPDSALLDQGEIAEYYYKISLFDGSVVGENTSGTPTRSTFSVQQTYLPLLLGPALSRMRKGEKHRFYTPFYNGYRYTVVENKIPEYSIIEMEIELLDIIPNLPTLTSKELEAFGDYLAARQLTPTDTLTGSVIKITRAEGTGNEPASGNTVNFDYKGYYLNDTVFDEGELEAKIGNNSLIEGFKIALRSMKKGETATVFIPSAEAYAARNPNYLPYEIFLGNQIPPHSPILFDITITDIKP